VRSVLDAARDAYKAESATELTVPVLGGVLGLVLSEPENLEGYSPLALQAAGMDPDLDKDAAFLAAACKRVVDEKGEPIHGADGAELDLCGVASELSGTEIKLPKQAIYTLFSSGEPPMLHKHALANAAFMLRGALAAGAGKRLNLDPED
jgi:hypothetical protein